MSTSYKIAFVHSVVYSLKHEYFLNWLYTSMNNFDTNFTVLHIDTMFYIIKVKTFFIRLFYKQNHLFPNYNYLYKWLVNKLQVLNYTKWGFCREESAGNFDITFFKPVYTDLPICDFVGFNKNFSIFFPFLVLQLYLQVVELNLFANLFLCTVSTGSVTKANRSN